MSQQQEVREFLKAMSKDAEKNPLRLVLGMVYAIDAGPPPTVEVSIGHQGLENVPDVRYLDSYTPTVYDLVWMLVQGGDILVMGKLAT